SLEIISKARKNGIHVSCSITPAHLIFTDTDLQQYDPNLKVNPPFRLAEDRDFLQKGLLNGEIDCIASHHMPQDKDHKMVEFEYAQYGMNSLETAFALVKLSLPEISEDRLVEIFSLNARKIFNLPDASLAINKPASLTLFHPDYKWTFEKTYSKCSNSPFFGKEFRGKALGIINKDRLFLND
ncbi:MAG TPA: dihydroorotase, partial [Flavisolibacter sp.]|nr:dihydroorotase [Flavisolibacter sp.]